jgi:predicted transposase YbfD/YdcC
VVEARHLAEHHQFAGLAAIGIIEATRTRDGKTETVVRYFALSRTFTPAALLRVVREHWGIENHLHWTLDVVLDEDLARTRKDHGPANLAILRRLALNIARHDKRKGSLAGKLRRAAWKDDNLVKLLRQMRSPWMSEVGQKQ